MIFFQFSSVFNVMTVHSVITDILTKESIGEHVLNSFLSANNTIWQKMKKRNLKTFKVIIAKTVTLKLKTKIVNLREERNLMTRLLVRYEQFVVPIANLYKRYHIVDLNNNSSSSCRQSTKTIIKNIRLKYILLLLPHPSNKQTLCDLFAEKCIAMLQIEKKIFVVAHGTNIASNQYHEQWIQITHSHQEADTLLICIIGELLRIRNSLSLENQVKLMVWLVSPDTDVLVLAIN